MLHKLSVALMLCLFFSNCSRSQEPKLEKIEILSLDSLSLDHYYWINGLNEKGDTITILSLKNGIVKPGNQIRLKTTVDLKLEALNTILWKIENQDSIYRSASTSRSGVILINNQVLFHLQKGVHPYKAQNLYGLMLDNR